MIKKNIKLISLLIVLAVLSAYFIFQKSSSTLKKELSDFAVKDTASIDKIFLADKTGAKILLEHNADNTWTLNKKYVARQDLIHNFFYTINKLEVSSPVSKNAFNTIIKRLATTGVKVEVSSKGSIIKTFYVGGPNQASTGTYMMIENSSTPYVVGLPGFEGYLTPRFSTHELIWRSSNIFNYSYNEIGKLSFINFQNPKESFIIDKIKESGINKIKLLVSEKQVENFDTASVNEYLLQFKNLNYEGVADDIRQTRKDSALKLPLFKVEITTIEGNNKSVMFYKKPVNKGTLDEAGNLTDYDVERLFAVVDGNTKEMIVAQYYVFGKILKPGHSFLKK